MPPEGKKPYVSVKFFSLWEKRKDTEKGLLRYWQGHMGGVNIVMFRNKSTHPQAPMFDIFISPRARDGQRPQQRSLPQDEDNYDSQEGQEEETPKPEAPQEESEKDEELPF